MKALPQPAYPETKGGDWNMGDFLQYVELDSFLHRLDPRTKFVFFIIMSVVTSFVKTGLA